MNDDDDKTFALFWGGFGAGALFVLLAAVVMSLLSPWPKFIDKDTLTVKYKGTTYIMVEKEK